MAKTIHLSDDGPLTKLVDELDQVFPAPQFGPTDAIEKIMYVSGQRSVVEYIKLKLEEN